MRIAKTISAALLVLAAVFVLSACGNSLGIPNGEYVLCDSEGAVIAATRTSPGFEIKGKKVTILSAAGAPFSIAKYSGGNRFTTNSGKIVKFQGKDCFKFQFGKDALFGTPTYSYQQIYYDKETKILTLHYDISAAGREELFYTQR